MRHLFGATKANDGAADFNLATEQHAEPLEHRKFDHIVAERATCMPPLHLGTCLIAPHRHRAIRCVRVACVWTIPYQ